MAARPASTPDLRRIHKELVRPRRSRLRILIASDPHRPLRTIVLPRALPTVITLGCIALVLTTVLLACGSWKMILKAAVTCSLLAPPPTSKKLAGCPPKCWMMSIVAIASPAPLTRQAMLPSSLI